MNRRNPHREGVRLRALARAAGVALALSFLLIAITACAAPVRIEWSTETEMETAGFNIYRGDAPDGPFDVKVNEQIIASSPDPMTGGRYSYIDKTARAGRLYYYQLVEVERNGVVNVVGVTAARAGSLDWRLAIMLVVGAVVIVLAWVYGAKRSPARG